MEVSVMVQFLVRIRSSIGRLAEVAGKDEGRGIKLKVMRSKKQEARIFILRMVSMKDKDLSSINEGE